MSVAIRKKKKVCYYYDSDVGSFHYGANHPMKPFRITLCHELIVNYGLYRHMQVYRPHIASAEEMTRFHSKEYIDFLSTINCDNYTSRSAEMQQYGMSAGEEDCPIFDGLFEFNQRSVGGSLDGALRLCHGKADIAINWAGGLHHAAKCAASGFCYVNDIVLAILEMLKYYARVLYIDIDVHHGDGVEEAFYTTDRVLCLSLHRYGPRFFPGSGHFKDVGVLDGLNHSVNVPFDSGIDDDTYFDVYKAVLDRIMARYRPESIVLQCGADSLAADGIGQFNLSSRGHGSLVNYVKNMDVPLLVLGGGGYTVKNVARVWTYETSLLTGIDVPNELPYTEHGRYFGQDFRLHVPSLKMPNKNSATHIGKLKETVLKIVDQIEIAPSVQIHEKPPDSRAPSLLSTLKRDELLEGEPEVRVTQTEKDLHTPHTSEFYTDDRDQDPA